MPPHDRPTSEEAREAIPLCQLRPGQQGRVLGAHLCAEECEVLRAMGMSEECVLRVCRSGAPCIVQVDQTRLGLCQSMTRSIMVTPEP